MRAVTWKSGASAPRKDFGWRSAFSAAKTISGQMRASAPEGAGSSLSSAHDETASTD
jgi:hypothetical protein